MTILHIPDTMLSQILILIVDKILLFLISVTHSFSSHRSICILILEIDAPFFAIAFRIQLLRKPNLNYTIIRIPS